MFYDHNGIKLVINNNKISRKIPNEWKLNILLKSSQVRDEIFFKKLGNVLNRMAIKIKYIKMCGMQLKQFRGKRKTLNA